MARKKMELKEEEHNLKRNFRLEYKNSSQKLAYSAFCQHDVLFMLGPSGTGKSLLSTAFAVSEVLSKKRDRIVITRPMVEAGGEKIGYLPGALEEKIHPYLMPIYDAIFKLVGKNAYDKERIDRAIEISPLAFMRGRNLCDSVCILDEAQNATFSQLKMFLTRLGENSKMIINGDPAQSDLPGTPALLDVVNRLKPQPGIGIIEFSSEDIVRHPLVGKILARLEENKFLENKSLENKLVENEDSLSFVSE